MNGWVVKLDSSGVIVWEEAFIGEDFHSVSPTMDGGFLVSGAVGLPSNAVVVWVLKIDESGKVLWQYGYDPVNGRYPVNVRWTSNRQTSDGGYIVSADVLRWGILDGSPVPPEKLILRLDEKGGVLWQKWYSVEGGVFQYSIAEETHDHGFILAGSSAPSSGVGTVGPWLLRLDSAGNLVWERTYGAVYNEYLVQAHETRDKGFVVAGQLPDQNAAWVLKTDSKGRVAGCPLISIPSNATLLDANVTVTATRLTSVQTTLREVSANASVTDFPTAFIHLQCTSSTEKQASDLDPSGSDENGHERGTTVIVDSGKVPTHKVTGNGRILRATLLMRWL
jgi:hypothetical protein